MADHLIEYDFDEITTNFMESVKYPNVHMSWREWEQKALEFGLTAEKIAKLKQFLEKNNQLKIPIQLGGKQWLLTEQEIEDIESLKKQYPNEWENIAVLVLNFRLAITPIKL